MNNFAIWWKQPFNSSGTVSSWFLFTGLILVIIWLWTRILREGGNIISAVAS